ncbi:MAG: hypothetical protein JNM56_23055 [Planctomycetia bacterium]|nr:hypothetical protein [Planctomycetia bacterium]
MGRFDWRDFRRPQSRPAAPAQPARPAAPAPRTPDRGRPAAPPAPAPRTAPPAAAPRGGDTDRRIDNLMREIEELRRLLRR